MAATATVAAVAASSTSSSEGGGDPALVVFGDGSDRPVRSRPMENYVLTELDSGERIISEEIDHVRSVAVGYWIGAGSRDEADPIAGASHFIEHLLFKGSSRYSALEIAEIFDGLGGELNAATSREDTLVYSRVPDHHLETALDVMTEEPPKTSSLFGRYNVIITPHTSFYSVEALEELQTKAAEEVVAVLSGRATRNPVNPTVVPRSIS